MALGYPATRLGTDACVSGGVGPVQAHREGQVRVPFLHERRVQGPPPPPLSPYALPDLPAPYCAYADVGCCAGLVRAGLRD